MRRSYVAVAIMVITGSLLTALSAQAGSPVFVNLGLAPPHYSVGIGYGSDGSYRAVTTDVFGDQKFVPVDSNGNVCAAGSALPCPQPPGTAAAGSSNAATGTSNAQAPSSASNTGYVNSSGNLVAVAPGASGLPTNDYMDRANDSATIRSQTHDDTLAASQLTAGLKTADPNNASLGGSGAAPITATVGTAYAVGRSLQTNCTTGGTITFTENGTGVPWIVGVGTTEVAHATTMVSSGGAAVCTYIVHY